MLAAVKILTRTFSVSVGPGATWPCRRKGRSGFLDGTRWGKPAVQSQLEEKASYVDIVR